MSRTEKLSKNRISSFCSKSTSWCSLNESLRKEIRFVHTCNGVFILTEETRDRFDANRSTAVVDEDKFHHFAIHITEPPIIKPYQKTCLFYIIFINDFFNACVDKIPCPTK